MAAHGAIANSINQNPAASLWVTLALTPPIADQPLNSQPVMFRLGDFNTPSQTQALDCGASGAAGWRQKIVEGCTGYSVNERNGVCTSAVPESERPRLHRLPKREVFRPERIPATASSREDVLSNKNNWAKSILGRPPIGDNRWADALRRRPPRIHRLRARSTYPVRKFVTVYVTAGDEPRVHGRRLRRTARWEETSSGGHSVVRDNRSRCQRRAKRSARSQTEASVSRCSSSSRPARRRLHQPGRIASGGQAVRADDVVSGRRSLM